ncbi:DUF3016 domain-containing protein [Pseudocolwellia agarivorans]|uniref:DUF3016 domain-containing protein n=1 Tax=Pseudocolwellia agarivorans TaxID=1911682 RepID=UPI0009870892|nr:DUF3016 domain-containing protein [Pseudocolwellia agarivorans]
MKISNVSNVSIVTFLLLVITWNVAAGESEVIWENSDKYTDIRAGNENKSRFEARVFEQFEKHFVKLAEKLPEGQTLKVKVTDLDLAGDVRFDTMDRIRVIRDLYIPRIEFSYQLVNADKSIAGSGEIDLKDMGFMLSSPSRYKTKSFSYEKRMLDKWFTDTFIDKS